MTEEPRPPEPVPPTAPAAPAPAAPAPAPDPGARTLKTLAAFGAGFLVFFAAAVFATSPAARIGLDEAWQRARTGTVATDGVRLLLEPGSGRKLALIFCNEGASPRAFMCPGGTEARDEVDVFVTDASGNTLPPRLDALARPDEATVLQEPVAMLVAPGERARLSLDIDRFVVLPGPGRYRVRVERARLHLSEPRLASNEVSVDLP